MDQIIGIVILVLMVVAHIVKSMRNAANPQLPEANNADDDNLVIVARPKPGKQPTKQLRSNKQRLTERQPLRDERSVFDDPRTESPRQKALIKKLSPQGEGQRFAVDPGTLDTAHIVAPTIDPVVKPALDSITGIYEQGVTFAESAQPAITLNLADWLAKPESICQAVIFAEILNRPAWHETSRQQV